MKPNDNDLSAFARDVHEALERSRKEVASLFFYQYIKFADSDEDAIGAIEELIGYGDDPYTIYQKFSLGE